MNKLTLPKQYVSVNKVIRLRTSIWFDVVFKQWLEPSKVIYINRLVFKQDGHNHVIVVCLFWWK